MSHPFDQVFASLTGHPPFPWQNRLFERFCADEEGNIPSACSIPTGLGKTSVLTIWLIARASGANVPRRLAYVVNRRTVVDQTTREAEKLEKVVQEGKLPGVEFLAISTLRGQYADNRQWSADPSRPAIICGTVDMIGSRLLFSGYGVGFKGRPLHAGFLGQDTLLVHDEAHLEPPFQSLIETIKAEQQNCEDLRPLRVMQLTATTRGGLGGEDLFVLDGDDHKHDEVNRRLLAKKRLSLHQIDSESKRLVDKLVDLAKKHRDSGAAILIYVRAVDDVGKIVEALQTGKKGEQPVAEADHVESLTGTLRGLERDALVETPVFRRFLGEPDAIEGTVFLVSTSAGEVGVDLSADHLLCDLSTLESMAQRLGRVNRRGERDDTLVDVVHPETFDEKKPVEAARRHTLEHLKKLDGDASPAALGDLLSQLIEEEKKTAFAPEPTIPPATDVLFDAWAMTSIRGEMPGRPPVAPYLHGIADWEPPETHVAWREEVELLAGDLLVRNPPDDLLATYPLRPHELLRDRTDRVVEKLREMIAEPKKSAKDRDRLVESASGRRRSSVWIVNQDFDVEVTTLGDLLDGDKNAVIRRLGNSTILLPPGIGGLRAGVLDGGAEPLDEVSYDVADSADAAEGRGEPRLRIRSDAADYDQKTRGMRLIRKIELADSDDPEEIVTWDWYKSRPLEDTRTAQRPVDLETHVGDVVVRVDAMLDDLGLGDELNRPIRVAAKLHDEGKRRSDFQALLGNRAYPDVVLAKSCGSGVRVAETYRHEFGSLIDSQQDDAFLSLTSDQRDLALHLIAVHHGRGRPHFDEGEAFDPDHGPAITEPLGVEVMRRYTRLQRRYGRWGLAYLESILRAADWAASAEPSAYLTDGERDP